MSEEITQRRLFPVETVFYSAVGLPIVWSGGSKAVEHGVDMNKVGTLVAESESWERATHEIAEACKSWAQANGVSTLVVCTAPAALWMRSVKRWHVFTDVCGRSADGELVYPPPVRPQEPGGWVSGG